MKQKVSFFFISQVGDFS